MPSLINLHAEVGVTELLGALLAHAHVTVGQWAIHVDEHGAWLTNPYGVDCALIQSIDEAGVERIISCMQAGDAIQHEWGHL